MTDGHDKSTTGPDLQNWRDFSKMPPDGSVLLLFFGNLVFSNRNGDPVSLGAARDMAERMCIGFVDDGDVCETGTGHSVFEDWRKPGLIPTHWCPLQNLPHEEKKP